MSPSRWSRYFIIGLALAACSEDAKRPLGSTCDGDAQCAEGQCLSGLCLDPQADEDGDTLVNSAEAAFGTNPRDPDSDADGVRDDAEVGDGGAATDTDGDGRVDALESRLSDSDGDCLVDEVDPSDDVAETDPAVLGQRLCERNGACGAVGASVRASCAGADIKTATCDYSGVPGYEADESACDGVDNDCDGATDERHAVGGSVTFDGGPYAADAGKALGVACGVGACAGGVVACAGDAAALTCSTLGAAGPLTCDADQDCDGTPDADQVADPLTTALAGCVDHFEDADDDGFGAGAGRCLCAPFGAFAVTDAGDCAPEADGVHPGAAGLCGVDADCDEALHDPDEACDDGNSDSLDGCDACAVVPRRVPSTLPTPSSVLGARLEGGGVAIAWDEGGDGSEAYFGRALVVLDAAGRHVARYDGIGADESYRTELALVGLRGGGLVLGRFGDSDVGFSFLAHRYDAAGVAVGEPLALASASEGVTRPQLVATSAGAFALVWQDDGDSTSTIKIRRVAADGTVAATDSELAWSSWIYPRDALGFEDGEIVLAWQDYLPGGGEQSLWARRVRPDHSFVTDAFELDAAAVDPKIVFRLAPGPSAGSWAAFFLEARSGEPATHATGYVVLDDGDAVVTPATYVQTSDTLGCPTGVVGGFDATGQAFAGLEDDECTSPVRAWLATTSGVVALPLAAGGEGATSLWLSAIPGPDPIFVHVVTSAQDATLRGVYVSRFDATGAARYLPIDTH